jgi:cell division protein FtsI (penicillin-binding protein 3)
MVSTIANGGVYLPPHVLIPESADVKLRPSPFKSGEDLPDQLPSGAHRVISQMTAAQMRKMMEGVVLYGSGKPARLNGYSAGGKTGTAQKIDPATHLYSKTMHIASFVGIAPVNNPVISIAVIIDNPRKGPSYYGTAVSAPVFAEVAQEVLEYLGVTHDTPLAAQPDLAKQPDPRMDEDAPSEHTGDLEALFAEVNNLPADDPLRNQSNGQQAVPSAANEVASAAPPAVAEKPMPPPKVHPAEVRQEAADPPLQATGEPHLTGHGVVVNAGTRVGVPSFLGEPLRVAVESATSAGLALQIVGSGIAREQAPAPGSMVPPGTEIVVRFTR